MTQNQSQNNIGGIIPIYQSSSQLLGLQSADLFCGESGSSGLRNDMYLASSIISLGSGIGGSSNHNSGGKKFWKIRHVQDIVHNQMELS